MGLSTPRPFRDFEERVFRHRDDLTRDPLAACRWKENRRYALRPRATWCCSSRLTEKTCGHRQVNPDKLAASPRHAHSIISEQDARAMSPDYFFVLPWHFKEGILRREKEYLAGGGKMIFPFPEIEIV